MSKIAYFGEYNKERKDFIILINKRDNIIYYRKVT